MRNKIVVWILSIVATAQTCAVCNLTGGSLPAHNFGGGKDVAPKRVSL